MRKSKSKKISYEIKIFDINNDIFEYPLNNKQKYIIINLTSYKERWRD